MPTICTVNTGPATRTRRNGTVRGHKLKNLRVKTNQTLTNDHPGGNGVKGRERLIVSPKIPSLSSPSNLQ